jgi:PhoH-like ATPase
MTVYHLVDTNFLLEKPDVIKKYNTVILAGVIRELEKHKISRDENLAYKARRATRAIEENVDLVKFDFKDYQVEFDSNSDAQYTDNKIIQACLDNQYSLITNDLLLKFKAKGYGIDVVSNQDSINETSYSGVHKIYLTQSQEDQKVLSNIYETSRLEGFEFLVNQYLVIYDKEKPIYNESNKITNYEVIDKLRFDGEKLVPLKLPNKKVASPKNEEQACALDLLYNKDIPIKIISGTYGSGKTFLTVKMAIHHVLDKGHQSKIMVIRNPIGSGEAIGWLKGSKEDKTADFFKPIVQHLEGGEQEATYLEQRGQLIKEIPYYIKGLSIEDTFVIVDEAEDVDVKLLKLIGTRLAEKSVVVFAGDFKQAEDKYLNNNGLVRAIEKLKGNPLVGIVIMEEDVRSEASKVFAEM